jgi:hypothetical protein
VAIGEYQQAVTRDRENPPVVAGLASLRIGECYEKLGDMQAATNVYWRVMNDFRSVPWLREAVDQKLRTRSGWWSWADSWFIATDDAATLLQNLRFEPHQKGGKQDGVELRWAEPVPADVTLFGLKAGDVVTELNGEPLTDSTGILKATEMIRHLRGTFNLTLVREGEVLKQRYFVGPGVLVTPKDRSK